MEGPEDIWAKASGGEFHPLTHHMLDSGLVAMELWRRAVSPRMKELLDTPDNAVIGLLVGLHDIGKASPAFQAKVPEFAPANAPRSDDPRYSHGMVTGHHLAGSEAFSGVFGASGKPLAHGLAGHHGIIPRIQAIKNLAKLRAQAHVGDEAWTLRREDLTTWLRETLSNPEAPSLWKSEPLALDRIIYLLGLVSVSDWIASNERWFPYSTESLDAYFNTARRRAADAVETLGFEAWRPRDQSAVERMQVSSLRPTQAVVAQWARSPEPQGILIIESETGSGKTESALDAAAEFVRRGLASGFYFAMPTRATSNAIYDRLHRFLEGATEQPRVGLQLQHGRASLHSEFTKSLEARDVAAGIRDRDTSDTAISAESWFSFRRRGLLCPIGVGVVDEILLAAQQMRYGYVRLHGLADKVVIIDEVHAYDEYMLSMLKTALEWLGTWGTPVVLLSATLPHQTKQELLEAYGCDPAPGMKAAYPSISAGETNGTPMTMPTAPVGARSIALEWMPGDTDGISTGIARALELAASQNVLLLRNTVGRAQESTRLIRCEDPDVDLALLHSRIPFKRRDALERTLIERFGRDADRPRGSITVATQVLEQSLDVDFDVLITDIAPTDLILQRAGRVHRHRDHPTPHVVITGFAENEQGKPSFNGGSEYIYGEYRLLRTLEALRPRDSLAVPDEVAEVMEATYAEPPVLSGFEDARSEAEQQQKRDQGEARRRRLPHPPMQDLVQFNEHYTTEDEDAPTKHRALSRLGDSVEVIVVDDGNRYANPASREGRRSLMESSLSIGSPRGLVDRLSATPCAEWEQTSLRYFRRLELDSKGGCVIRGNDGGPAFAVHLDHLLGLVIERRTQ